MLQQLIQSLYGTYNPTGAFSWEFRTKSGKYVAEIFQLLPPETVSFNEPQRAEMVKTIGGGYIGDFGSDFKEINIKGSLHFYYYGKIGVPKYVSRAENKNSETDGFTEFVKLRYMLSRYRDYTMTANGKIQTPAFTGPLSGLNKIKARVKSRQALADDMDLVFHHYDNDDHWYVKIDSFSWDQAANDPNTVNYSIRAIGYAPFRAGRARKAFNKSLKKMAAHAKVQASNEVFNSAHPPSIPDTIPSAGNNGALTPPVLPNPNSETAIPTVTQFDPSNIGGNTISINGYSSAALSNPSISIINIELKTLRQKFEALQAEVIAGYASIKQKLTGILNDMQAGIAKAKAEIYNSIIPPESYSDFLTGDVTLSEYATPDEIEYYSGVNMLALALPAYSVAMIGLGENKSQALAPKKSLSGIMFSVSDEDFSDSSTANPATEIEQDFAFYTIEDGDTLENIAMKFYDGDYTRWPEIAEANGITNTELQIQNLTGRVIKIPVEAGTQGAQLENNAVYEAAFDGGTIAQYQQFLYGRDIAIENGKIMVSPTGDILAASGVVSLIGAINSRLDTEKGSLNPLHEDFGVDTVFDDGTLPPLIGLERYLQDREGQAEADPRVLSAAIDRGSVIIHGDRFDARMLVELVGGQSEEMPIQGIGGI